MQLVEVLTHSELDLASWIQTQVSIFVGTAKCLKTFVRLFKNFSGMHLLNGAFATASASRTFPSPTARAKPCVGTNTSTMLRQQGAKSCTTWDLEHGNMIYKVLYKNHSQIFQVDGPPTLLRKNKTCFDHIQLILWFQEGLAYTKQPVSGSVGSGFGRNSMCWPFQLLVLLSISE